jgi:hypothetical protein
VTTTLPKFLRDANEAKRAARANGYRGPTAAGGAADAYAKAAFAAELSELAAQTHPGRNDRLNEAAFNLAQLVAGGHLDRDVTWTALYGTAIAIGLTETETRNTLTSAFDAAEDHPRHVPELDTVPEVTVLDRPPVPDPTEDAEPGAELGLRDRFPPLDWHELWAAEDQEEWIIEPILPARRLVALFSPPKVGKSLLMLELAVGIARGTEVLGYTPDRPRRVLYVDFENDPRGDVRSRLMAMGFGPDDLTELVYLSYPRLAYLDTYIGGIELLAVAQEYGCEVVVIDTISRAVAGEENDNDTWLGFYRHTGLALKAAGLAVIRLDHTGKDQTKGMRGGSAKYGDVDAVWAMTAVAENVLRLECTANRLPIADKLLTVRRHGNPLRHEVETTGSQWAAAQEKAARILDAAGLPRDAGEHKCRAVLQKAGLYAPKPGVRGEFSAKLVASLPAYRADRPTTVGLPDPSLDLGEEA